MGIQFFLRTNQQKSNFRRALNELMSTRGETLILSTGYIGSLFNNFNHDVFFNSIRDGFKNLPYNEIIIIGGMFKDNLKNQYQFEGFIKYLIYLGYKVTYYKPKYSNWHAKIAMKLINKTPVMAIIGSSNLTAPAYSEYTNHRQEFTFNYESDLLIWDHHLLDTFKGINILETIDEKEIDYEKLQDQQIIILLEHLYQVLQNHDLLKTISREYLNELSRKPLEMFNYLEHIFFESSDPKLDTKILEIITNICFQIDVIQGMKQNTSLSEQRFIMGHILDLRSTLNDSKILSLLKTKIQHHERFSQVIEYDELKKFWFYPDKHQKLIEEIKYTVPSCDEIISLIEKVGGFPALEVISTPQNHINLLKSLKINKTKINIPEDILKELYKIIGIKYNKDNNKDDNKDDNKDNN